MSRWISSGKWAKQLNRFAWYAGYDSIEFPVISALSRISHCDFVDFADWRMDEVNDFFSGGIVV